MDRQPKKDFSHTESQLQSVIQNIPGIVFRCKPDDTWTMEFINDQVEKITGYTSAELCQDHSRSFQSLIHPEDREKVSLTIQKAIPTLESYEVEYRITRKEGSSCWVHENGQPVFDEKEHQLWLDGVIVDISARKLAEEALEYQFKCKKLVAEVSSKFVATPIELFDTAINHTLKISAEFFQVDRAYIFQISADGKSMSNTHEWCASGVEPQHQRLQDISLEQVEKRWKENDLANLRRPEVETLILEATTDLEKKQSPSGVSCRSALLQHFRSLLVITLINDGTVCGFFGFDAISKPLRWRSEELSLLKIVTEIISNALAKKQISDNLLKAKQEAEKANFAKSAFLSNMSHELRTPLNGVLGFSQLLMSTSLTPTQMEYLQYIISSSKALKDVVGDILDFSKIEAGKMQLHPEITDVQMLCQQVIQMVHFQAFEKGIELRLEFDREIPKETVVDPLRLQQVLLNLVNNAVKFTHEGRVTLKVQQVSIHPTGKNRTLHFAVEDTGIGISKEAMEKIFKPFEQVDASATRKYGGTGLGLPISEHLLALMDSSLQLQSQPGTGSVFSFDLNVECEPLELSQQEKSPSVFVPSDYRNGDHRVVFLVEDDTVSMHLMKKLLGKFLPEATVFEVNNGVEALKAFRQYQPNLIFMDVYMPGMNGYLTTRDIRKLEMQEGGHVPIIALTAVTDQACKDECFACGMDDFISKPLSIEEFQAVLKKWI